jgi:thiamine pyrophosphokinase
MPRILIFANGQLPDIERARPLVKPDDYIICADGGARHALALGLTPDVVIGDLDSITDGEIRQVEKAHVKLIKYSHDKDETDLELAMRYALDQKPTSIVVLAALGYRLDHTLGNFALLSDQALAALDVRFDDGIDEAFFCRDRSEVHGRAGDLVSLIPWGSPVEGVRTDGLKWPLRDEALQPEKTRGISNEMTAGAAEVRIAAGLLLVIHRRQP